MTKDPAFLFYSQDFLVGTMAMPFEERGKYITLLCYMHQNGHISEETIRLLVGSFSDMLRLKFKQDNNGLFYNERMEIEVEKRQKFSESRKNNGKKGGRPSKNQLLTKKNLRKTYVKPTTNLIENEDVNENNSNKYANQKIKGAKIEKINDAIDDFLEHVKPAKSSAKKEKELPSHFQVIEHIEKTAHWRNTCEHYGIKSDQRESLFKIFYEQKEDNYKIRLPTWTDIAQNFYFWVKIHLSKNEIDKVKNQISKPTRGPAVSIETFTAILKPVP